MFLDDSWDDELDSVALFDFKAVLGPANELVTGDSATEPELEVHILLVLLEDLEGAVVVSASSEEGSEALLISSPCYLWVVVAEDGVDLSLSIQPSDSHGQHRPIPRVSGLELVVEHALEFLPLLLIQVDQPQAAEVEPVFD